MKLVLTLCLLTVIAMCFYRAAGKITVFLVTSFMAASEISLFLAVIIFWLGNNLYSLWAWCLEGGYITSVDAYFSCGAVICCIKKHYKEFQGKGLCRSSEGVAVYSDTQHDGRMYLYAIAHGFGYDRGWDSCVFI